jgi:hypothetical protein
VETVRLSLVCPNNTFPCRREFINTGWIYNSSTLTSSCCICLELGPMVTILCQPSPSGQHHSLLQSSRSCANPLISGLKYLSPCHQSWPLHRCPTVRAAERSTSTVCSAAASTSGPSSADRIQTPWQFGFQCNERYLHWEDSAQAQLVRIWLAREMGITPAAVRL